MWHIGEGFYKERSDTQGVSSDIVIKVDNVSKAYAIWSSPSARLHGPILGQLGQMPFLPTGLRDWCGAHSRESFKNFYALRDVSLEIRKGESHGIIGKNGSGKSTLLQMIAGILTPTSGSVTVNGKVAALLELGSGFNPEFTGRENVYMNASVLGLNKAQIDAKFDAIAAFADIDDFIDQPVKTYSSGMMVRLAFAATTSVDAEILLIDEALAVGDVFFRQKCYKHLEDLRRKGVTIVLVSHGMGEVEQFCQRAELLDHGRVLFQGSAVETVKRYYLLEREDHSDNGDSPGVAPLSPEPAPVESADSFWPVADAFLDISRISQVSNGAVRCTGVAICDQSGRACRLFQQGETVSFFYEYETLKDIDVPLAGVELVNDKGIIVHGKTTLEHGAEVPTAVRRGKRFRVRQDIDLELAAGEYTFSVGLGMLTQHDYEMRGIYAHVELDAKMVRLCILPEVGYLAISYRRAGKPVQLLHHGVANLRGQCCLVVCGNQPHQPQGSVALASREEGS